jgi:hypothetical protein
VYNPGDYQIDADGDGFGHTCDLCLWGNDNDDADGDGVPDFCDACAGIDDSDTGLCP